MTRPPSTSHRRAFSLVELLVVIGILVGLIAILLPVLSRTRKTAARTRMASDLQAISTALDAYKADFGDYPRVEYTTGINNVANRPEPPTGAQILCWALIGPAPATETTPPANEHVIQDGADGPGFRTRGVQGRVYGPYLSADKFRIGDPANPSDKTPANALLWTLLDSDDHPILYFPASPKNLDPKLQPAESATPTYIGQTNRTSAATRVQTFIWDLTDNLKSTTSPGLVYKDDGGTQIPVFARSSDSSQATSAINRFSAMLGDLNANGRIDSGENPASTGPYLLWMAGPDGLFGPAPESNITAKDVGNCDDVTNFNQ